MPEQPVPEQDPIVTKSYTVYYVVALVLLIASLFWALEDEFWGQRPWKAFQENWKTRYTAFLNKTNSTSKQSLDEILKSPDYQQLDQAAQKAAEAARPRKDELQKKITDLNAQILAVQNVFTDKRAYVNALTYQDETATDSSSKKKLQDEIAEYKNEQWNVEFPDGHREQYNFQQLEEKYNALKDERTRVSAELGDVLKPVTDASTKASQYISDHVVDLTPTQIEGLKKKYADWDPQILQINVAEANIVDRCESCHMGIREPLKITAAALAQDNKEKKPDEYDRAFVSHPSPELLKIHDPDKFGCSPCHQGNGRATTSVEKAHGNYEHWLWPLFPKENAEAGCQTCHSADMVLVSGDVGWTISEGKDLFRQRGCMGCHRYEGYDKEPEDLTNLSQQIKQFEQQKVENLKQAAYLMKQADAAQSNEEANKLNDDAIALRVANSKIDGRIQQLDFQSHSLLQDQKKVGPNLKDIRLKLNKNWIPVWLMKPHRLPSHHQDAELPPERSPDSGHFRLPVAERAHRSAAPAKPRQRRSRQRTV